MSALVFRNPWLRLRREVEDLVAARSGDRYLRELQVRIEMAQVNRKLKRLRSRVGAPSAARGAGPRIHVRPHAEAKRGWT